MTDPTLLAALLLGIGGLASLVLAGRGMPDAPESATGGHDNEPADGAGTQTALTAH